MTLTQLSYIVAVDKYRHFATAAKKIYITQPTLSMQIQKLENELDVLIFDRSKSPVIPTEIGKEIIEHAKLILRGAKQIEDLVAANDGVLKGSFRIGIIPTIAPYLVPLFLKNFMDAYPEVDLIFEEALTTDVLNGLEEDYFDAGIIASPPTQTIFELELFDEPFLGYLSAKHKFVNKEELQLGDLQNQELWLLNEGHCFRDQTLKICKQLNEQLVQGPITFESGNLETLKRLVESNFGITLMPYLALHDYDNRCANGVVKEFEAPVPTRKIRLVYGREFLKLNLIEALADKIKESLPAELSKYSETVVAE